jgi:hypothetical protein
MTATNHVMTGALIALAIQRPLLALPLAFLSHYVLDALPQFGLGFVPEAERDKNKIFRTITGVDGILALVLFWIMPYLLRNHVAPATTAFCMVLAQIPDAVWFYRHVVAGRKGAYGKKHWTTDFHKAIQWCERSWGFYFESVWFVAIVSGIGLAVR